MTLPTLLLLAFGFGLWLWVARVLEIAASLGLLAHPPWAVTKVCFRLELKLDSLSQRLTPGSAVVGASQQTHPFWGQDQLSAGSWPCQSLTEPGRTLQ